MNPHKPAPNLHEFLADQCHATKERYAQTLASMGDAFGPVAHFDYAESLVYFGLAERKAIPILRGKHIVGSKTWFRKVPKTTPTVSISAASQTEMLFA